MFQEDVLEVLQLRLTYSTIVIIPYQLKYVIRLYNGYVPFHTLDYPKTSQQLVECVIQNSILLTLQEDVMLK